MNFPTLNSTNLGKNLSTVYEKNMMCVDGNIVLEMEPQEEVGIIVFSHDEFRSVAESKFKRTDSEYNIVR